MASRNRRTERPPLTVVPPPHPSVRATQIRMMALLTNRDDGQTKAWMKRLGLDAAKAAGCGGCNGYGTDLCDALQVRTFLIVRVRLCALSASLW